MYAMTGIELSRLHREDAARQVEINRLVRQLRADRHGIAAGFGNTLPGRLFARFPRKEQTAEC
jgi:hypothetical protein